MTKLSQPWLCGSATWATYLMQYRLVKASLARCHLTCRDCRRGCVIASGLVTASATSGNRSPQTMRITPFGGRPLPASKRRSARNVMQRQRFLLCKTARRAVPALRPAAGSGALRRPPRWPWPCITAPGRAAAATSPLQPSPQRDLGLHILQLKACLYPPETSQCC